MPDAELVDAAERHFRGARAPDLPRLLAQAGLDAEAACLAGTAASWHGRPIGLAPEPPADADPGALWFDPADLSVMILVQSAGAPSPAMARWIGLHPVQGWQFEAFRRVVQRGASRTEFPSPADHLARRTAPGVAGDLYQDEALAYAHWFGKGLAGQFDWLDAKDLLPSVVLDTMLPQGRAAWEEAEYPLSEFVRVAVRQATLDLQPTDEQPQRLAGTNAALPGRMLFDEWDRAPDIGFSTMLWAAQGRVRTAPATLFFDLGNAAWCPDGLPVADQGGTGSPGGASL